MLHTKQRLGDFEIVRLLGKGGMGEVYEALQTNPRRPVALKILAPWLAEHAESLQRFWREAEVPAQLDHPGIVRIISTGQTEDGTAYYTMQLVRGMSLADMIRYSGELSQAQPPTVAHATASEDTPSHAAPPPAHVLAKPVRTHEHIPSLVKEYWEERFAAVARIGAMAARALSFAHLQGYLHRDIKPSNLMVDHHNQVCLVDFGLTRALEPDAMGTAPGVVIGTAWYMSPEQAEGKLLDARTDIYSLGVTLYELATAGLGPFTASRQNRDAVLDQVRTGQVLPLRTVAPQIPRALERVIAKAMHYRPEQRYQDAADLADDLEASLLGSRPPSAGDRPTRVGERRAWWRRKGMAIWAAVLLVVLAGVVAFLLRDRGDSDPDDRVTASGPLAKAPRLPASRIDREWNTPIPLFKDDPVVPIWDCHLEGKGGLFFLKDNLHLFARDGETCTMFALDHDPQRRWFRFSIELNHLLDEKQPDRNQLGIFFGRRYDDDSPYRRLPFFVVRLDESPTEDCPYGRITIGAASIVPGRGNVAGSVDWFRVFPENMGKLALSKELFRKWHSLVITAVDDQVEVAVDGRISTKIDLDKLRRQDPDFAGLDARGVLGIWGRDGDGRFRNGRIMALRSNQ